MTIEDMLPNFKCMIGPYILARVDRDLWEWSPSLFKLPMTCKGRGPGKSFLDLVPLATEMRAFKKVNTNNRENSMVMFIYLLIPVNNLTFNSVRG